MNDDQEYLFSGFCRTYNQGQTVTCEISETNAGRVLEYVDCNYEKCVHRGNCQIALQIREILGKGNDSES